MMWKKKEPIESKEVDISGLLAQLHELHPDRKYVLWFKQPLGPAIISTIRRSLQDYHGLKIAVIMGSIPPEIYEFEDKPNESSIENQRNNDSITKE